MGLNRTLQLSGKSQMYREKMKRTAVPEGKAMTMKQSINQSINSILYSASLYTRSRFTESRVQQSFIHSHTGGAKLPLPWGRLTEAWLPISTNGPSDHHQHSFIFIRCNACLYDGGGNRSKPTQARGEHANSTQKGPGTTRIRTQGLLAVRRQC